MSQFCQYEDHEESPIIGACLKIDCKYSRSYCHHCIIKHHIQHTNDLKTFKQLNEWIKLQMNTYQDLKTFINEINQLSEGLSKFLVSININQQIDYSQVSQEVMKDQINKLIRISISKLSLIPLISKLNDDLSNLKLEINKINQIKSNNPENIKNVQSLGEKTKIKIIVQENKEKDQEINQYINQIKQQQDQIQVQLEQINQFKQEQEYLNQQIEKQKLQNQKLKQQIEQYQSQQSNQLQQFQQQQNQYYPQIQNQPTPFQQNIDSSYQKVSFQFIKNYQVNIKNDGKIASAAGGGDVLCEPSIPLNQNVKFAFRVIKIDGQINLGFGLKDQYGQPKNRQLYEQYFQFNKKDTVLLDIRMNEKKLIAQNLRSSQQGQFSIDTDTSQALYLVVFLVHSCIEIVDDY